MGFEDRIKEFFSYEHTLRVLEWLQEQLDPYMPADADAPEVFEAQDCLVKEVSPDTIESVYEMLERLKSRTDRNLRKFNDECEKALDQPDEDEE